MTKTEQSIRDVVDAMEIFLSQCVQITRAPALVQCTEPLMSLANFVIASSRTKPHDHRAKLSTRSVRVRVMRIQTFMLSAVMAAFWIYGLIDQLHSKDAVMRYLALSAAVVAIFVWRLRPRPALRRQVQQRRRPPE